MKLLEDDKIIKQTLLDKAGDVGEEIIKEAHSLRKHLTARFDDDPEIIITDERYGFIAGIIKEVFSV